MGYQVNHGRMREKYNPRMNAAEQRHRLYVLDHPCFGCGANAEHAHHTLLKFPAKRWRRDHRALLPTCGPCHTSIHDYFGSEEAWLDHHGKEPAEAIDLIERLWAESDLIERMTWNG